MESNGAAQATKRKCRQCGKQFVPAFRAGRDSVRRRANAPRAATGAHFCSAKCRQANYRWRRSQGFSAVTESRPESRQAPEVRSAVTRPSQNIENIEEKQAIFDGGRPPKTVVQIAGPPLTPSQFHCASLPLDPITAANVRRANAEAETKSYLEAARAFDDGGER